MSPALLLAFMFGSLAGLSLLAACEWFKYWRARRNDRQVVDEVNLKRGMRSAWRRGLLQDGDQ